MSYTIEVSEPIYRMLNQQAAERNSSLENVLEYSLNLASSFLPVSNKDMDKRNLQEETIKSYFADLAYQDLLEIRFVLANFFAQRAIKEANRVWDEQGLSNEIMDEWLHEG